MNAGPDVTTGASLTSVTVIATSCDVDKSPSDAVTVTLKMLSPPESPGVSKFGASIKLTAPVDPLIVNNDASVPESIYVRASPSASVADAVKALV